MDLPRGSISQELSAMQGAVQDVLAGQGSIVGQCIVNQEIKDRLDSKILAWTEYKLFVLTNKATSKVEAGLHFLDVRSVDSSSATQFALTTVQGKQFSWRAEEGATLEAVVLHTCTAMKAVFLSLPLSQLIQTISVQPSARMEKIKEHVSALEKRDPKPCGGFSAAYSCWCAYYRLPVREEVMWDIDTVLHSRACKTLDLRDFDHLDTRDAVPLVAGLKFNTWFTHLKAAGVKMHPDALATVLQVLQVNRTLTHITLSSVGIKSEYAEKLSKALTNNPSLKLLHLDLSGNPLEDKGVQQLCGALRQAGPRLEVLELSGVGMTGRGASALADALQGRSSHLWRLNLSNNALREEALKMNFFTFLATPNCMTHLKLSSTEIPLDTLCDALMRGCVNHVVHLDLSHNPFSRRSKTNGAPPLQWKALFFTAVHLERVDVSHTRLPPEALKQMLLGIATNGHAHGVSVNVASNELRAAGAQVLESCIADIPNIADLDVSDNGFDLALLSLAEWVSKNQGLKKLSIGKNFDGIKPKHMQQVMQSVVSILTEEDSTLESLSLADSNLKGDTCTVINALGLNNSLTCLDISGNGMKDLGAKLLSRALQTNRHLRELHVDRNSMTVLGLEDLVAGMENNTTLRVMPVPSHDAGEALKIHPDRTLTALHKWQALISANQLPQVRDVSGDFRLQHSLLQSSSMQAIEGMSGEVEALLKDPTAPGASDPEAFSQATAVVRDADRCNKLLQQLERITSGTWSSRDTVTAFSKSFKPVLEKRVKESTEAMLQAAIKTCPTVAKQQGTLDSLERGVSRRRRFDEAFPNNAAMSLLVNAVDSVVSEIEFGVATFVCDRLTDAVIDSLAAARAQLKGEEVTMRRKPLRSDDVDDTLYKPPPDPASPKEVKRQSLLSRRVRPPSVLAIDPTLTSVPELPEVSTPTPGPETEKSSSSPGAFRFSGVPPVTVNPPPFSPSSSSSSGLSSGDKLDDWEVVDEPASADVGGKKAREHDDVVDGNASSSRSRGPEMKPLSPLVTSPPRAEVGDHMKRSPTIPAPLPRTRSKSREKPKRKADLRPVVVSPGEGGGEPSPKLEHITKLRPKKPKTRAPTRALTMFDNLVDPEEHARLQQEERSKMTASMEEEGSKAKEGPRMPSKSESDDTPRPGNELKKKKEAFAPPKGKPKSSFTSSLSSLFAKKPPLPGAKPETPERPDTPEKAPEKAEASLDTSASPGESEAVEDPPERKPAPGPRKPAGAVPVMGFGTDMMAQMKLKRASMLPPKPGASPESKEGAGAVKPVARHRPDTLATKPAQPPKPSGLKPPPPTRPKPSLRPRPSPTASPDVKDNSDATDGANSKKPETANRATPVSGSPAMDAAGDSLKPHSPVSETAGKSETPPKDGEGESAKKESEEEPKRTTSLKDLVRSSYIAPKDNDEDDDQIFL